MSTTTAAPATITAAAVTRLLRRAGLDATSRTYAPGVVRTWVGHREGPAARAALLQAGYDVGTVVDDVLTVVLPEPVAEVVPCMFRHGHVGPCMAGVAQAAPADLCRPAVPSVAEQVAEGLVERDDSPCAVCGDEVPADRHGWTCSDECAAVWEQPGHLTTLVVRDPYDAAVWLVVTERGDEVGGVGLQDDGTWSATVAADGEFWCDGFTARRDAVLAVVRRQDELDDEHPTNCHCDDCWPIEPAEVFVAGDRVKHGTGMTGTVVVGTHRDDVVIGGVTHVDLFVTVAWDDDDTERSHPSTVTRIAAPMRCAECDAVIVVTVDSMGAKSECGGEGEGVCDAYVDGMPAARASHDEAIALATRAR